MSEWQEQTIGLLVRKKIIEPPVDGNHGEIHPKGVDFVEAGIPFIMASDIENGVIDLVNCKFITEKQASTLRKGFAKEGDVLLTHKATIGRTAVVPKIEHPYIMLTPQVTYYRVLKTTALDNMFLKYYFDYKPFQQTLGLWAGSGSTRAYIGITGQHQLKIRLPKPQTQKQISAVLSILDEKIELNNCINVQLEAMAKTLYDYWFVQFDFPDENGRPYKSSGGKMIYDETLKREIPEGWGSGSISKLGDIVGGSTPSTTNSSHFSDSGIPWITPNDLSNNIGNKFISNGEVGVTELGIKDASLKLYPEGSVLLSSRAPIGYMAIARNPVTTNQGFKSFIPNKGYSTQYVYYAVKNALRAIIQYSSGSTFKEISGTVLKTVNVCLPPDNVGKMYTDKVKAIFQKQDFLEQENVQLSQLRDWLLPMLMNGQVTVK